MSAQLAARDVVRDSIPLGLPQTNETARKGSDPAATARRIHIRKLLEVAKLSPPRAAKLAGLVPATIYNFLAGDSRNLSNETIYKLALVLVDLDVNLMLGMPPGTPRVQIPGAKQSDQVGDAVEAMLAAELQAVPEDPVLPAAGTGRYRARQLVEVRMEARTGRFVSSSKIENRPVVGMPLVPEVSVQAVFGVRVGGEGDFYPQGTLLACVPLTDKLEYLQPGRLVLISRTRRTRPRNAGGRVEISIRMIRKRHNRLVLGLTETGVQDSVEELLPNPFTGEVWASDNVNVRVLGIMEVVCIAIGPETEKAPPE